jgi:hypothetical protein
MAQLFSRKVRPATSMSGYMLLVVVIFAATLLLLSSAAVAPGR